MSNFIISYKNKLPKIHNTAFIAPSASIIGDVDIGKEVGVWFNVVIRGDVEPIFIGERTNIQDGTIIHVTRGGGVTHIGSNVTIGHGSIIHAARLEDFSFVGMGAIILDGAVVQTGGWLAAGSLLTSNKIVPSGQIWAGNPAKYFRDLTKEESDYIAKSADNYVKHVYEYNASSKF